VKEKCLKTISKYRDRQCRCHVWWKSVPEAGAGNWKSPFDDGAEVKRRYSKLVGESVCVGVVFNLMRSLLSLNVSYNPCKN